MAKQIEIIGPEPVSLTEAKRQCFVTSDADDSLIDRLVMAAREYAEGVTWKAIVPAKYVLSLDEFPAEIELPHPPAYQVDKIEYINLEGSLTELAASDYDVDVDSIPARIKPVKQWPSTKDGAYGAVKVHYRAGYLKEVQDGADQNNAPEKIKQAILLMVKHWHDNPEAVVVGVGATTSVNEVPLSASHLLNMESARHFV